MTVHDTAPGSSRPARIDMSARYALSADVQLIRRAPGVLQIGTEEPRRLLLRNAPESAAGILDALDGAVPVGELLASHDADPAVWRALLAELLAAGLLVPAPGAPRRPPRSAGHLSPERIGLVHRHGQVAAGRIMQARQDALVIVRGDSTAGSLIATLVAAAGVGHVHHDTSGPTIAGPGPAGPPGIRSASGVAAARALASVNPFVRTHPPAPHQAPTVVVLTGDPVPDLATAATLVRQRIPHLAVVAQAGRAGVGPLVLPGRSACLGCVNRFRADTDPGWPAVARHLSAQAPRAPVAVSAIAAAVGSFQILELLDGIGAPSAVNGSLEWTPESLSVQRRSWSPHPDCGCGAGSAE